MRRARIKALKQRFSQFYNVRSQRRGPTVEAGREGMTTELDPKDAVLYIIDIKGETTP